MQVCKLYRNLRFYPAGICHKNGVVLTSMRRDDVASTSILCHFGTKCPLGNFKNKFQLHVNYSELEISQYRYLKVPSYIKKYSLNISLIVLHFNSCYIKLLLHKKQCRTLLIAVH